ncbi:MAG: hypothetical protein FD176_1464 [Rhodospirillaceae bacterium]|nr:MAG: hypothetical protein FD176_1464 [Rhodospirillaceae bacterium]TNC95955.1 MAG: hypothetical protein FD119_2046 [Stygiobacter sp.]
MDAAILEMVLTAFEETRADALAHGNDAAARAQIEALNPLQRLAA